MDLVLRSPRPRLLRRGLCASCYRLAKQGHILNSSARSGLQSSYGIQKHHKSYIAAAGDQARPIDGFYAELLSRTRRKVQPASQTPSTEVTPPPSDSIPRNEKDELMEKARVVFGSRLPRPDERRAELEAQSQNIAGVLVPPRPTEPDNCCMSGCVNCVWDLYRDEMEEWAAKSAEARAATKAQRSIGQGGASTVASQATPSPPATSMDDDGGGSETVWGPDASQDHLFDDIPVGIREFMRTEKMLKQRHRQEAATNS